MGEREKSLGNWGAGERSPQPNDAIIQRHMNMSQIESGNCSAGAGNYHSTWQSRVRNKSAWRTPSPLHALKHYAIFASLDILNSLYVSWRREMIRSCGETLEDLVI